MTALDFVCPTCEAEIGDPCYFRPSSGIPNGEGYTHMSRGMLVPAE